MKYHRLIKAAGVKLPVEIRIRRNGTIGKMAAAAIYQGMYVDEKLVSHRITLHGDAILNPEERSIKTLIAHELIHARLEEKGITEDTHHGPVFRAQAARVNMRVGVPNIFDPNIDVS